MGEFKFSLKNLFKTRLMLRDYPALSNEARELVDYTIKENLKSNSVLRVRGLRTKYIKPKKSELWFISWSDRIELGIAVDENNIFEILKIVYGINENQFNRLELYNAFAVHKLIVEELKLIVNAEINELHTEPTEEEKEAGVEALQVFSYYNSLDAFTNGNILIQNEWLQLPYSKIFRKMCIDKVRHDINLTMRENANRKINRDNSGT
jgi:hypothetical protein